MIGLVAFLWMSPILVLAQEPNDVYYEEQWYLETIEAPTAWDQETGSSSIVIAVLDTGISIDHPDLERNIWENQEEIANNGIDDDGNGFVDDVFGWDFVDNDNDPTPDNSAGANPDAVSHGTVIAGIIGAEGDNGEGVSGVMWDVKIMSVRMLDAQGSGTSLDATEAIEYAVANGADVINLSFAGEANDTRLRDAIENAYNAGVVIIAALGNEGKNIDRNPVYPACYKDGSVDWVIGVAATTKEGKKSAFSNYGRDCSDISAPGEEMFGLEYYDGSDDDAYADGWAGTSVASPVVAGAAGILLSAYPDLTPDDVRTILKLSVDPLNAPEFVNRLGAGRLNIAQALAFAGSYVGEEEDDKDEEGQDGTQVLVLEEQEGISPVTGETETVTQVYGGEYVTSPSYTTVYYVTPEGERRPFMDANTFFTYEDSFDVVKEVTDATLPELTLGAPMLPKVGVVLVKIQSDPTVYALGENAEDAFAPLLREIATEDLAVFLYGSDWADYVIDIEATFFPRFGTGEPMESNQVIDKSIMKTRVELSALAQ